MRDIPMKDQIPQTRDGLLLYIKGMRKEASSIQRHLEACEERLEIMETELGIRKPLIKF